MGPATATAADTPSRQDLQLCQSREIPIVRDQGGSSDGERARGLHRIGEFEA